MAQSSLLSTPRFVALLIQYVVWLLRKKARYLMHRPDLPASGGSDGSIAAFQAKWESLPDDQRRFIPRAQTHRQRELFTYMNCHYLESHLPSGSALKALEVGCGRSPTSLYLAQRNRIEPVLLDTSLHALELSREHFRDEGMVAQAVNANGEHLCFPDGTFDVVFSVGLLEHFSHLDRLAGEMVRVLKPGGLFFAYVVPQRLLNVQSLAVGYHVLGNLWRQARDGAWVLGRPSTFLPPADPVFRSRRSLGEYARLFRRLGLNGVTTAGVYPFPLIEPLGPHTEAHLVAWYSRVLRWRRRLSERHPWNTSPRWGQWWAIIGVREVGQRETPAVVGKTFERAVG